MKFNKELLDETYIYTLTVFGKVNGEYFENKKRVISRMTFIDLSLSFQSFLIRSLKADGVFDYYEEVFVVVSDRERIVKG